MQNLNSGENFCTWEYTLQCVL